MDKTLKISEVKDYIVYYGKGNEEELSKYDMAIVEPQGQNENTIKIMKEKGTLVIAYVSVMEVQETSSFYSLLREEDFLKVNGVKLYNKDYNTALVDLSSKRWNSILIHHIGNLLLNHNYDGVFLDTIGDIEFQIIPQEYQNRLLSSAVNLLKDIKNNFENCNVIQNNGLEKLCSLTGALIDGICWENPPFNIKESKGWVESVTMELTYLKEKQNVKIMLLIEEKNNVDNYLSTAKSIAEEHGFLVYNAANDYLD